MSVGARGFISHLTLYPIKSLGRIELLQARLTTSGLESVEGLCDHEFMLVDAMPNTEGIYEFVHQRQRGMQVMTQIRPQLVSGVLLVSWNGSDQIVITLGNSRGKIIPAGVWDDVCLSVDQGDALASWFSDHLNRPVRLVRAIGEQFHRQANQGYLANDNPLKFQDGYPIHWFPIEDVQELEQKADVKLGWERFRPQIVVGGLAPQFVHSIFELKISGIPSVQPKPCERCPIPQIDQETGQKTIEPNKTLMTYKVWRNKKGKLNPIFGENINPLGDGIVNIGDEIEVLSLRSEPLVYGSYAAMNAR